MHQADAGARSQWLLQCPHGYYHRVPTITAALACTNAPKEEIPGDCHIPCGRICVHCERLACTDAGRHLAGGCQLYVTLLFLTWAIPNANERAQ